VTRICGPFRADNRALRSTQSREGEVIRKCKKLPYPKVRHFIKWKVRQVRQRGNASRADAIDPKQQLTACLMISARCDPDDWGTPKELRATANLIQRVTPERLNEDEIALNAVAKKEITHDLPLRVTEYSLAAADQVPATPLRLPE
jgi:hypothetical protein